MNRYLYDLNSISKAESFNASVEVLVNCLTAHYGFEQAIFWAADADNTHLKSYQHNNEIPEFTNVSLQDIANPLSLSYIKKENYNLSYLQINQLNNPDFIHIAQSLRITNGVSFLPLVYTKTKNPIGVVMGCSTIPDAQQHSEDFSSWLSTISQVLLQKQQLDRLRNDTIYFSNQAKHLRATIEDDSKSEDTAVNFIGSSKCCVRIRAEINNSRMHSFTYFISGEKGIGKSHLCELIHKTSNGQSNDLYYFEPDNEIYDNIRKIINVCNNSQRPSTLVIKNTNLLTEKTQVRILALIKQNQSLLDSSTPSNYRFIFIYEQPLQYLLDSNALNRDFYCQLKQVEIEIPSLRERPEDVVVLLVHFISQYVSLPKRRSVAYDLKEMKFVQKHSWNGNVNEVINFAQVCASAFIKYGTFQPKVIKQNFSKWRLSQDIKKTSNETVNNRLEKIDIKTLSLADATTQFEKIVIQQRLLQCKGSKIKTANSLDLSRSTLANKCQKLGLQ